MLRSVERLARQAPEIKAKSDLVKARNRADFENDLVVICHNLSSEKLTTLLTELHEAVLAYYNEVAYREGQADRAFVPIFLLNAEPATILQIATKLNEEINSVLDRSRAAS